MFIRVTAAVMAAMLLCSCSADRSAPEEDELRSLSKLRAEGSALSDEVKALELKNIRLSGDFEISIPQQLGEYEVEVISDFNDCRQAIYDSLLPEGAYSDEKVTFNETYVPVGPTFYDPETDIRIDMGENGFFSYSRGIGDSGFIYDYDSETGQRYEHTSCYVKEAPPAAVKGYETVADLTKRLSQAAGKDISLTPFRSEIFEGQGFIRTDLRAEYRGVPISCILNARNGDTGTDTGLSGFMSGFAYTDTEGGLMLFVNELVLKDKSTLREYDSIISPAEALKRLSEKLSSYVELKAVGMELVYLCEGTPETAAGSTVRLRPYWAVWFEVENSDTEKFGLVSPDGSEVLMINNM